MRFMQSSATNRLGGYSRLILAAVVVLALALPVPLLFAAETKKTQPLAEINGEPAVYPDPMSFPDPFAQPMNDPQRLRNSSRLDPATASLTAARGLSLECPCCSVARHAA